MKHQHIAIVGAGTAGLAAAAFLQNSGHSVTLFEEFDAPRPVGAGLLLQPTGLSVLSLLGLDTQIIESGSVIRRLHGKASGSAFTTLDIRYADFAPWLFGVGARRGDLFSALYEAVLQTGAEIRPAREIVAVEQAGGKARLVNAAGQTCGGYDMVIDASGQKSRLRTHYADVKLDKPYPYGALWSIVKLQNGLFPEETLEQRYKRARHMIGVLPVGKLKGDSCANAAFFWSMRVADYQEWREREFSRWQAYVTSLWPEMEDVLKQFHTHDDLTLATYSDVILRKYHSGNIVFIGDSAHSTSPQLGQGANLALLDALVLSECINAASSVTEAFDTYDKRRKKHLEFYQMASRVLTPFFQSDSLLFAALRSLICGVSFKIPFMRRSAAHLLTGTKSGVFSTLNPGEWARDYDVHTPA